MKPHGDLQWKAGERVQQAKETAGRIVAERTLGSAVKWNVTDSVVWTHKLYKRFKDSSQQNDKVAGFSFFSFLTILYIN